ncbi:hypothetical protein RSO01_90330 [Reyranella soli]|uniref:Uncharacterized protein n=1 Tax=Reyranella soli TaxID=1230389 RepID=A0A512NSE4_9HYPH|nr:hypothetical protein RSO01_90330 [Reyranella soli]
MTYEEYLKHADECERLAESPTLPSNRHSLLSAAEMWRRMAAHAKPHDGAGLHPVLGDPLSDTCEGELLAQIEKLGSAISRDMDALGRAKSMRASSHLWTRILLKITERRELRDRLPSPRC